MIETEPKLDKSVSSFKVFKEILDRQMETYCLRRLALTERWYEDPAKYGREAYDLLANAIDHVIVKTFYEIKRLKDQELIERTKTNLQLLREQLKEIAKPKQ